jgi:branched-subunit amino acid aminotransferase/4-amino-4-deoxychorismate lyase
MNPVVGWGLAVLAVAAGWLGWGWRGVVPPCRCPTATARSGWTGQLVDWRDAKIHVLSHTLHYGCGAFEGVRAYNTAAGHGHLPPARAHRAAVQQRQDPAHEDPLHAIEQVMQAQCDVVRQQARELLPAPADLDRRPRSWASAPRATPST